MAVLNGKFEKLSFLQRKNVCQSVYIKSVKIVKKVLIESRRSMDCLSLLENISVTDRKRADRREERATF